MRILFLSLILSIATVFFVLRSNDDDPGTKPDDNRFTPVVLVEGPLLDEPMAFEVLDDERVFIIERKGGVKLFDPSSNAVKTVATIPVNTIYTDAEGNSREAEEGLVGLTVHPEFDTNPWVYLLYADPDEPKHVLARWDFDGNKLVEESKIVVMEFPVQRETCCHTGGGMTWDKDQNLYITVGNNTGNYLSAQTDERPGRANWDDQRGASNTNDHRGKILRIHPEDDGTYSIPEGNMFAPGTENTLPEIYTMGHRNAWRVSIDSKTGYMYWGEVGPDAREDTEIGPRGYDELNQAKGPGFFGWPYFIGENHAFPYYDYALDKPMETKDPSKPMNTSVNNTGLQELPPAQPAFISYPYGVSEKFPEVGSGGRSATGGPIYRKADFKDGARPFPTYFEGKWIAADLARGWIMSIEIDDEGNYVGMERLFSDYRPAEIIDIKFGPEGDLYVLEYGSRWFRDSDDDKLVRVEYNAGNRKPLVAVSADKKGGAIPFDLQLASEGTIDYDGDDLKYTWEVASENGEEVRVFSEPNPVVSFDSEGVFSASLTVTDAEGASNRSSLTIIAGNEPPEVELNVTGNTQFFFPGTPFDYTASVKDAEDGEGIDPSHIAMSIDYVSAGFDYAEVIQGQRSVDATTRYAVAQGLISQTDCGVCHQPDVRSAGPSYKEIAEKYANQPGVEAELAKKVIEGGSGVWGEINMPAHPAITMNDAQTIVDYILNIENTTLASMPLEGAFTPMVSEEDNQGSIVVRAAYKDRGAGELPAHSVENAVILRSPVLMVEEADKLENTRTAVGRRGAGPMNALPMHGGYLVFEGVDLTGVKQVELDAMANNRNGTVGGSIEFRIGAMDGALIGSANVEVSEFSFRGPRPELPKAILNAPDGLHDLYVLFSNESVRPIDPLMSFSRLTFSDEEMAAQ
ncbi:MAG: PQQ-dependent sugar dehydrogenase [Rhodothermaceae bacterium]|nr:PQQ-dependent sugar dehydrogenase [Rhodothermaceae bacterium]